MSNMKLLFCVIAISLIVGQIRCGSEYTKHIEDCKKEVGINLDKSPLPNDPKIKCMWACVMEKVEVMADGKLNTSKYIEKSKVKYPNADSNFANKVTECVETGNKESDKCEVVSVAYECVKDQFGPPKHLASPSL